MRQDQQPCRGEARRLRLRQGQGNGGFPCRRFRREAPLPAPVRQRVPQPYLRRLRQEGRVLRRHHLRHRGRRAVLRLVLKGIVDAQAIEEGRVASVDHHRPGQLIQQAAAVRHALRLIDLQQVDQVDQVIGIGRRAARALRVRPAGCQLRIAAFPLCQAQRAKERVHACRYLRHPGQIHAAERCSCHGVPQGIHVARRYPPPCIRAGGILRQRRQEVVAPACGGLRLLGGDHVPGVGRSHARRLQGGHQACVEADPFQLLPGKGARRQRAVDLLQRQAVHAMLVRVPLVKAHAQHGPRPVVPQKQRIPFGRELLVAAGKQRAQRRRVAHAAGHAPADRVQPLPVQGIDGGIRHKIASPRLRAGGHDHHLQIVPLGTGGDHLRQVGGGRAPGGLQVAAAQVDHQRHGGRGLLLCPCRNHRRRQQHQQRRQNPYPLHPMHLRRISA